MGPSIAKMWAQVCAFFRVDWAFLREPLKQDGAFWVGEFVLVVAALYVASHVIRPRPLLSRLFCWSLGHLWLVLERNHSRWQANRRTLGSTLAGTRCRCQRCGAVWNDLPTTATEAAPEATEETEATETEATETEEAVDPFDHALTEMQQQAQQVIDSVFPPRRTPAAPGVTVTTTRVTRTTTSRATTAAKKKAAATPAKKRGKRPTRFDRDVLADEEPKASASPPAAAEPPKPADTSSPSVPSAPEGSGPS